MDNRTDQQKALEQIKAVYDDSVAEINGREYVFTKATHKKRLKVFAFYTGIKDMIKNGDLSFMGKDGYETIEQTICELVTFDGSLLSKRPNHWNEHPEDYLQFITVALGVISYPFLSGRL